MPDRTSSPDDELLLKLNVAVAAANEVEKTVETAKAELVSRSKVVGTLLLEAKTLHPAVGDFYAFLKRVDGLKLSQAYDLMRLAGGRVTDEELRQDAHRLARLCAGPGRFRDRWVCHGIWFRFRLQCRRWLGQFVTPIRLSPFLRFFRLRWPLLRLH